MVTAFVAGLASVPAYYKHSWWLAGTILVVLPLAAVALLGWPNDTDFRDTSLVSAIFWVVLSFVGAGVGTASVVLRIIK